LTDGTEVLADTVSICLDRTRPTALEARLESIGSLADPVILRDVAVGMKSPRIAVTMLLNAATFKDSYANYEAEHHALYGAV
jgi:hypothetical protein